MTFFWGRIFGQMKWKRQLTDKEVMDLEGTEEFVKLGDCDLSGSLHLEMKFPVSPARRPEESLHPELWEGLHDPFGRGGYWHKIDGEWKLT